MTLYALNEINTIHISIDHFATFHLFFVGIVNRSKNCIDYQDINPAEVPFTCSTECIICSVCITSHTYSGRLCLFQFPSALLLIFLQGITKARFAPLFTRALENSTTSPEKVPVTTDFPHFLKKITFFL